MSDATRPMPALDNDKHERFCQNLMTQPVWDVQRAYEQAGYKAEGESAKASGFRLLQDATVQARIRELQEERAERTQIRADQVLHELALVGFSNVEDYDVDGDGRLVLREGAHPDALRAVAAVKRKVLKTSTRIRSDEDEETTETEQLVEVDIKTWNKNSALDSLAKHLGMFGPDGSKSNPLHVAYEVVIPTAGETTGEAEPSEDGDGD